MRHCKSYLFITMRLFLRHSLNPGHIGVIWISKWCFLFVESEIPLSPLCFDRGIWPRMLPLTLFLKSIVNSFRFGVIETCIWTDERERERDLWVTQRGTDGELMIGEGSYYKIYHFDTIVRVREPSYENICLSLLHADFLSRKLRF